MPAKLYPFIDIAVHPRVRAHFARGDAAVLFSPDMRTVLWSNGQAADLFGFASIYDFLDAGANRTDVTYRQLEATARQLKAPNDRRTFMMRAASGFTRATINASVEYVVIRPGEEAILFTAPRPGKPLSVAACAQQMISGFDDPDTHMAVLAADGEILAASGGFGSLGMTDETRRMLVAAASRHSDWLVKRPVPTGRGQLPAAIGKLSDSPALHLLFAVETILGHMDSDADFRADETQAVVTPQTAPVEDAPAPTIIEDTPPVPSGDSGMWALLDAMPRPLVADTEQASPDRNEADDANREPETPDTAETNDALADLPGDDATAGNEPVADMPEPDAIIDATVAEIPSENLAVEDAQGVDHSEDDDVFQEIDETHDAVSAQDDTSAPDEVAIETVDVNTAHQDAAIDASLNDGFVFNPAQRAARFVWKIDADGQFSEISSEFAAAVGPQSADVVGKSFDSLAERYGFDQDDVISDLLKRRDTWSGKMILWPVQGTSRVAPVDLAALPTYSRNRTFDGFRGFGIVRVADSIEDPQARGLTIGQPIENVLEAQTPASDDLETPSDAQPVIDTQTQDDEIMPETVDPDLFSTLTTPVPPEAELDQDPFRGERPALKVVESAEPDTSGNVVKIDDHRPQPPETLTRAEQAAFREIARQLAETVAPPLQETQSTDEDAAPQTADSTIEPEASTTEIEANDASPEDTDGEETLQADVTLHDGGETAADATPEALLPETLSTETEPVTDDSAPEMDPGLVALAPTAPDEAARLTAPLMDSLPVALLVHVGDELIHANSEFLKLTGYSTLRLLEEEGGIDALFAGEDELHIKTPDGAMMLIRRDGNMLPVIARLQSIRWKERSVLMMALAAIPVEPIKIDPEPAVETPDVSEQLRIETEELRSILETATDGVVVVGEDGEIRSLNRSANALFNYDDSDIRGKPFAMLFAHESQKAVIDYLAGLSGHGVASVLNDGREVIGREASGGFIPLFMTMGRLSSSTGYCAVIRDITQWKRTEEELRTAKRAAETANAHKTDFLARVSHEIRTPLNAIIGFSDMMASEHFGPIGNPRYVEYANDIGRSGRHVLDIVNDLLDISKIEAGEMDLEFSAVEINDAVSEAVSLVQPQANGQRVIIRTSLSGSVPSIVADSRSIKQIALNILANAIRFTPSGGQIVVSTAYEANGSVILRIRDTGVGMTRSELEQAMKPFRQVSTSGRQRGDGTGLGLPLTKAMAEANRALFSINSAPNEGTLVEIAFPSQRVLAN